jgi:hypothetical protein
MITSSVILADLDYYVSDYDTSLCYPFGYGAEGRVDGHDLIWSECVDDYIHVNR